MTFADFLELAFAAIAAIGAVGAAVVWIFKLVGKTVADGLVERFKSELQREVESHRTKLRKSEFIFQKEFEAASEFVAMKRDFIPKYRFPDMDHHDACEEIAQDFEKIEKRIGEFISKHGAIIKTELLDEIKGVEVMASVNKFEGSGPEPSDKAVEAAGELWDKLDGIERKLRDRVLSQADT